MLFKSEREEKRRRLANLYSQFAGACLRLQSAPIIYGDDKRMQLVAGMAKFIPEIRQLEMYFSNLKPTELDDFFKG